MKKKRRSPKGSIPAKAYHIKRSVVDDSLDRQFGIAPRQKFVAFKVYRRSK